MIDFERMRYLMKRIPRAKENLYDARVRASSVSQILSDMPKGNGGTESKIERDVSNIIRSEEVLKALQDELKQMRDELLPLIQSMEDPYKSVMYHRYIKGLSVRETAIETIYSESYVFEMVRNAESQINKRT